MADRDPWEGPAGRDPWEAPRAAAAPAVPPWDAGTEGMNSAMLGYGPEINGAIAAVTGGNYAATRDANIAAQRTFEAAHPYQSLAANLAGGAVPAAAMTMAGVPPVAAGAIQGGANGYANAGVPGAVGGAAIGGLGAGAAQGIGALGRYLGLLPKVAPTVPAAPAADLLRSTGA